MVITFFLTPYIVSHLGKEAYGIWVAIGSVSAYSYLLNVGISNAVTRYVPIARAKNDPVYLNQIITTSSVFYTLGGLVMAIFTVIFAPYVPEVFNVPENLASSSKIAFLVAGLSIATTMPLGISLGFVTGLQRYDIANSVRLVITLLRSGAVLLFLSIGYGLVTMTVIGASMRLSILALYWLFVWRLVPELSISLKYVNWSLFKELISFGVNTFVYVMGSLLIYQTDIIVIGILLGPADTTIYAIPVLLMGMISKLVTSATSVVQPAAAEEYAKGNIEQLSEYYIYGLRYSVLLLSPILVMLLVYGRDFINLWMGPDFALSGKLLMVLAISHFFYISQRNSFQILSAANRHKFFGRITIVTGLANLVLSVFLIKQFDLGLWGVAWGTFLPMTTLSGVVLFVYCCKELKVSMLVVLRKSYAVGLISILPMVLVAVCCLRYWPVESWLVLIIHGIIACGTWFLFVCLFILSQQEKQKLTSGILRIKRKIFR